MATPGNREASLAEALEELFRDKLAQVHVCLPGRIESYDKDKQRADVAVCVKKRTVTDEGETISESFPVIPSVPLEFDQTSGFFASFPVAAGDFVWLHFVEQSVDSWLSRGGAGVDDPLDRRFDLKDCFCRLARNPSSPIAETENDAMVLGPKGAGPRVYLDGSIIGLGAKAPGDFVANATTVKARLDALATAISNWTPVANDGGAALKVALTAWLAGSNDVGLTKVKGV